MGDNIVTRPTDVTVKEFNATVRSLLNRLEMKSRSDIELANLDRLKKRISLLKNTMGDNALINESGPFLIEYADRILSRDENFFMNLDVRSEYMKRRGSNVVDKADEFMFVLTDSIRAHYKKSSAREKDDIYSDVRTMLEACMEYNYAKL